MRWGALLLFALLLIGRTARGEGPALTLEECLRLAQAAAPTAQGLRARLLQAQAEVVTARTWPNPIVAYQAQDLGDAGRVLHQQTLTYPLLFAYTRALASAAAREGQARSEAGVAEAWRLLRMEVGRAFYDLRQQEELARVEGEAVALAAEVTALTGQRKGLGDASALDVERARAEELEARRALELVTRRRDVERLAFSLMLGAERPAPVVLAPGWPGELPAHLQGEPLIERARAGRPDLAQAEAGLRQAHVQLALERRRAAPLAEVQVTGGVREGPSWLGGFVAVSAPLPLFDFNQGPRRRAQASLLLAEAEREQVRRRVALEVRGAQVTYAGARRALVDIVRPLVAAREQVLRRVRGLFVVGEASFLDLLVAQRDLLAARRALVQAERDAAWAGWQLIQVVNDQGA